MRKWAVAVAAIAVVLLLAGSCQAADLQAGWYARLECAELIGWEGPESWVIDWTPASGLGQVGPLLVEEDPYYPPHGRRLTLTEDAAVSPGILFEDTWVPDWTHPSYGELGLLWDTDYDASKMQLQVYLHRGDGEEELVWNQSRSGHAWGGEDILLSLRLQPGDSVAFRLLVIPEPTGLAALAAAFAILVLGRRRRSAQ